MKTNTVSVFSIRVRVHILTAFELEMRVYLAASWFHGAKYGFCLCTSNFFDYAALN